MQRYIIYIINPISGTRKKKGLQELIERRTEEKNIPYLIFPSVESGDYSFLHSIIRQKKITDVVIAGGDGTVSQVAGSLLDFDVEIGVIPCGSGNGLALAAGIPKEPGKALDVIFAGRSTVVDGFMVNDQFSCMLCGLGFDAKVAHAFAKQPQRGLKTYVKQVLRNFLSARHYNFEIKLNKTKLKTDAYFISIANSNQFGNNFTIAPRASLTDGLLDIVILTSRNKLSFLLQSFKQVAGWNKLQSESAIQQNSGAIYFQTNELMVRNLSEAPMHIDGDPAETPDEIRVRVMKKCFSLICPL